MEEFSIHSLRASEDWLEATAGQAPIGIYVVQDGAFRFVNDQFLRTTGRSRDEFFNSEPLNLVIPEDREYVRRSAIEMLKGQRTTPYEYRINRPDGSPLWILETTVSIDFRGKRATLGYFLERESGIGERYEALEVFYALSRLLAVPASLQERTEAMLAEIARHFDVSQVILRVPDKETETFKFVARAGDLAREMAVDTSISFQEGIIAAAYRSRRSIVSNDYHSDPRSMASTASRGVQSIAAFPIKVDDSIISMLVLTSTERGYFTEQRVRTLDAVADHIGFLLHDARRSDDERRRIQELNTLYTISSVGSVNATVNRKMKSVLTELAQVSNAAIAVLRVPDSSGAQLRLAAFASSGPSQMTPPETFPINGGRVGRTFREMRVIVSNEYESDPEAAENWKAQRVKSAIFLPLVANARSVGVIAIGSLQPHHFDERMVRLLTAVAQEVCIVLQNSALMDTVNERTEELEKRGQEMELRLAELSALNRLFRQHLDQRFAVVEAYEALLAQLTGVAGHARRAIKETRIESRSRSRAAEDLASVTDAIEGLVKSARSEPPPDLSELAITIQKSHLT